MREINNVIHLLRAVSSVLEWSSEIKLPITKYVISRKVIDFDLYNFENEVLGYLLEKNCNTEVLRLLLDEIESYTKKIHDTFGEINAWMSEEIIRSKDCTYSLYFTPTKFISPAEEIYIEKRNIQERSSLFLDKKRIKRSEDSQKEWIGLDVPGRNRFNYYYEDKASDGNAVATWNSYELLLRMIYIKHTLRRSNGIIKGDVIDNSQGYAFYEDEDTLKKTIEINNLIPNYVDIKSRNDIENLLEKNTCKNKINWISTYKGLISTTMAWEEQGFLSIPNNMDIYDFTIQNFLYKGNKIEKKRLQNAYRDLMNN